MDKILEQAKQRYRNVALPEALSFTVAAAIRAGDRTRMRRRAARRTLGSLAAVCACFVLLVNVSPGFARAVYEVPVLGGLARVITVRQYTLEDRNHLIEVRLPAIQNTGDTDLEQRINLEISARIDAVLEEAERRAREAREAYLATGGVETDFIPIIIDVDYEVKCQDGDTLSFILTKTETIGSAYTELYCYNIDLETGRELSLMDVLGPGWRSAANSAICGGIAARMLEDPESAYFDGSDGVRGFESVADDQRFYINGHGNPVVVFEKYEIAPGYMGIQEFEVVR